MDIQPIHKAACQCATVQFELSLQNGLVDPRRCDCSMCRRCGAISASLPLME